MASRSDSYSGTLMDTTYVRDAAGRITEKTETTNGVTHHFVYDYDLSGRLVNVTKDYVSVAQYLYDENGNRTGGFTEAGPIQAIVDAQDRLLSYNGNTYSYTLNGELESKTRNGETTQYHYDAMGNLRNVTLPDGTQIEYVIDGRNRRR